MSVITGDNIRNCGMVYDCVDMEKQIQPAGCDLTVAKIEYFMSVGTIDFDNSQRKLPKTKEMLGGIEKYEPGPYLVTFNETVNVPKNCIGLGRPRSTLLRMGASIQSALWDPGYCGQSQVLMIVHNPKGIIIKPNAKLMQLVFFELEDAVKVGYEGVYQGEKHL